MTKPPNPITQGLRAVARDPVVFLVEILWRWCFGILACVLIFGVGAMLLGPLHIGNAWDSAWQSRDLQRIGQLVLMILLILGKKAILAALAVPVALALLWSVLSALGRSVTVRRLRASITFLSFRQRFLRSSIYAHLLPGFLPFCWWQPSSGEALIATRGPKPDLLLYYLLW